jgi:phosphoribosylformylglycinamidine synthase I
MRFAVVQFGGSNCDRDVHHVLQDVCGVADNGALVLGICNGAQIGAESGLVPGMFTINEYPKFICDWAYLRVENTSSPFTRMYETGEVIRIPIAHKEGRFVASPDILRRLEDEGRIAFRFCSASGEITPGSNPNGSLHNITGILGERQNVLVMMPHPERASEQALGSEDGKRLFNSMIASIDS